MRTTLNTTLNTEELNKRAEEVFDLQEDDYIYDVSVIDGQVFVNMEELSENGQFVIFDYKPDMSERPEALDYLLRKRDDFND
jgi:hypothetical protein